MSAPTGRIGHWINGSDVAGGARRGPVYNPATGAVAAEVALAGPSEVDAAVAAAHRAFPGWKATPLGRRSDVLFAFREQLNTHREELAEVITAQHGKVRGDALGEVQRGLEIVDFACGAAHLLKGDFSEGVSSSVDAYSIRQPLGVCVGITPFNFPVMVPLWMAPIAIACGNTFILKPSEKDPGPSIQLAEMWAEAGLPPGVFNVVQGDREAVTALVSHPDVAAVSFVGSTPVAQAVYRAATESGKRCQALGGAKNHMVVLGDADLDTAADAAVGAAYGSAGERCMAISVLVAVGEAGDGLVELVAKKASELRVGDGREDGVEMGPLITGEHRDSVVRRVEAGIAEGAELVLDGRSSTAESDGFFLGPCLFDRVTPDMEIYREEIFGPVLSVVRVDTLDEALELVNSNRWANGTAIFTSNGAAARRYQNEVEVGMVGINVPIPVPMAYYSFGGWKQSLFGDTHVHGAEGVHFYTRGKAVTARWDPALAPSALNFPTTR